MKVDNAMHILLITISSLVLINSIIWLCLDNIGKDKDKYKGNDKGEEYNKVAQELMREIGEDIHTDTYIKINSIDYSNCVVGECGYEYYYLSDKAKYDLDGKYRVSFNKVKSHKFIHIDVRYDIIRVVNDRIIGDAMHIDVSRLKSKDPELAKILIAMIRPYQVYKDEINVYSDRELIALRNFLMNDSIQSNDYCANVAREIISTIDQLLGKGDR